MGKLLHKRNRLYRISPPSTGDFEECSRRHSAAHLLRVERLWHLGILVLKYPQNGGFLRSVSKIRGRPPLKLEQ